MLTNGAPYQIGGVNRDNIEYHSAYDFNLSWSAQSSPKINLDLHYGCDELRWDVSGPVVVKFRTVPAWPGQQVFERGWKESDWQYPPVLGETRGYIGSIAFWAGSARLWASEPAAEEKEETVNFPVCQVHRGDSLSRSEFSSEWFGKLANGSYIAPAEY